MCARYDLVLDAEQIAKQLDATLGAPIAPRTTIAPTDVAPTVIAADGARRVVPMRFGWPPVMPKERVHLNVRSESAARTHGDDGALGERRCLVPATAFHEWSGPKGQRAHHLFASAGELLTFAGLFVEVDGEPVPRFVILTTAASREVRPVHHRMPLVVPAPLRATWLSREVDGEALLSRVRRSEPPRMLDVLARP
jgi:putative SOS response-associated peptidase YedK